MKTISIAAVLVLTAGLTFPGCLARHATPGLQLAAAQELTKDPTTPEAWAEYGRACILSSNPHGAIDAFIYAIELDREYVPAYMHLALVYLGLGETRKAAATYRQGLEIDAGSAPLWLGYGYCLAEQPEYGPALGAFQKALSMSSSRDDLQASALLGCAAALRKTGRGQQAREAEEAAVSIAPALVEIMQEQTG